MPAAEFDATAPADMATMIAIWEGRQRREDLRAARICELIVAAAPGKGGRPLEPADLFPSLAALRPPLPTDEELAAKVNAAFGRLGG